jgi:predicted O-methyltransferase YrrM
MTTKPTIGIYRIVGAELPPRDMPGTRVRATQYILNNERLPGYVKSHWVVNRIFDHSAGRKLRQALDAGRACYSVLPADLNAIRAATPGPAQICALIEINKARNQALADGVARGYDWTVVLDGDCMFTPDAFAEFEAAVQTTQSQYLGIRSRRSVVYADGSLELVGALSEPMLAFKRGAPLRFDEHRPFGAGEKLELCTRLGYRLCADYSQLDASAMCHNAGWVAHVCMEPAAELIETDGPLRNRLRSDGLAALLATALAAHAQEQCVAHNTHWRSLDGYFDFQAPYYGLAANVPDGMPIVEVGCWLGKSAAYLARELQLCGKTNKIYCVDNWQGGPGLEAKVQALGGPAGVFQQFITNMAPYRNIVIPLLMNSTDAAALFSPESVAAVFIDADHSYDQVLADIRAWMPRVMPGGMIFGHDYVPSHPVSAAGVVRAVDEYFADKALELCPVSRVWKHVKPAFGRVRLWS